MLCLFEYVEFCNLSEEVLQQFIESFSLNNLNQGTWAQICKRLRKKVDPVNTSSYKYVLTTNVEPPCENIITIKPQKFLLFDDTPDLYLTGIMKHLACHTCGNIHSNGTITITANSLPCNSMYPQNFVDCYSNSYCYAADSSVTILFDFKQMKVQLSHYSVQSASDHFMKNWFLETSDDLIHWVTIDPKRNCANLRGSDFISRYPVKSHEFSRFIRYQHERPSWPSESNQSSQHLCIKNIEFFGKLPNFEPKAAPNTSSDQPRKKVVSHFD